MTGRRKSTTFAKLPQSRVPTPEAITAKDYTLHGVQVCLSVFLSGSECMDRFVREARYTSDFVHQIVVRFDWDLLLLPLVSVPFERA